jgi:Tfp pilus assembly protein PilF/ADP-heptose:LPS heptosyltransferase
MTDNLQALRHIHSAHALQTDGQWDDAMIEYRNALFLEPELPVAYIGLAEIYHALGDLDEAVIYYEQALVFAPNDGETHYNLGVVLEQQDKTDAAITHYERAIALLPDLAAAYNNLGTLLKSQERFAEARTCYQQALTIEPNSVQAHNNMGALYHLRGEFADAIQWYERTLTLAPHHAETIHNLGDVLMDCGNLDAAMAHYNRALSANPDLHYTTYSKATVQLLLGDYANGWQGYEARWAAGIAGLPMREYPWALWDGARLQRGKVLIWGEQGIGDEIMFAGLIPDALRRTDHALVIDCANARLQPLLQRSFPNIQVIAGGDPGGDITAHLPISSLPKLFRNSATDFAATTSPYLFVDPALVNEFRTRYGSKQKNIGIAWHTQSKRAGRWRSVRLAEFAPLFAATTNVQWINLQYGDLNKLTAEVRAANAPIFTDETVDQLRDMDRFAAQIAALDLVITIDNTTAHLAGALGIPTWLLLPAMPNWRWLMTRTDTPWYPSLRLFRQSAAGDWRSVIHEITQEILVHQNG